MLKDGGRAMRLEYILLPMLPLGSALCWLVRAKEMNNIYCSILANLNVGTCYHPFGSLERLFKY